MAFRATSIIPASNYDKAKRLCVQLKQVAEAREAAFASGATGEQIINLAEEAKNFRDQLNTIKSTNGILQYAKDQENDQTYDVAGEFNAVIAAIDALIADIVSTLPKDGSDYLLVETIGANGLTSPRNFGAGALANIRTLLGNIAATVE